MSRQYQLPGVGFLNADEDGREYQIPGSIYFNDETAAVGGGFQVAWARNINTVLVGGKLVV